MFFSQIEVIFPLSVLYDKYQTLFVKFSFVYHTFELYHFNKLVQRSVTVGCGQGGLIPDCAQGCPGPNPSCTLEGKFEIFKCCR